MAAGIGTGDRPRRCLIRNRRSLTRGQLAEMGPALKGQRLSGIWFRPACIRCWLAAGARAASTLRRVVTSLQVELLLEAARWAPSAGNSQPWAFIVGRRNDDVHHRLTRHLTGSSGGWASTASVLVANLCHRYVEDTDWDYSEFALYDLGQAVAHMTVQARALHLYVRQFRAFNRADLAAEFAVPSHWEVTTLSAIGGIAGSDEADEPALAEPGGHRSRRSLEDLFWVTDSHPIRSPTTAIPRTADGAEER